MINLNSLTILIAIINNVQLMQNYEDIIELDCTNDTKCKQFEHSGIKSFCRDEKCFCFSSKGETEKCVPKISIVNNIIGGSCPCRMSNGDCDNSQNICYCISKFIPSRDKRRCIPKTVALNKTCEENAQCQREDFNAICDESKLCKCMDQFVYYEGKCFSVIGNKSQSFDNAKCNELYGYNTRYSYDNHQCICEHGYFASVDNSKCLKVSKYLESCTENLQCIGTMGLGGHCKDKVCQCSEKYFVEEKKLDGDVNKTVCSPFVERGHYCRYEEDCYQRQLSETEQSMHCSYGECNCKEGFNSFNEGACVKGSDASIKSLRRMQIIVIPFIIILFSL